MRIVTTDVYVFTVEYVNLSFARRATIAVFVVVCIHHHDTLNCGIMVFPDAIWCHSPSLPATGKDPIAADITYVRRPGIQMVGYNTKTPPV